MDLGDALRYYDPGQLMAWAIELEPGLTTEQFAAAAREFDQLEDSAFARYGLDEAAIAALRQRFADWPRKGYDR